MNTHGIGLGLFICKKIIEQMDGEVFVQSEYGKGTRFAFSLYLDDKIVDIIPPVQARKSEADINLQC